MRGQQSSADTTRVNAYLLIKSGNLGAEVVNVALRNPVLFAIKQQLTQGRIAC